MEKTSGLFREEAMKNRLHRSLGTIRINVPFNFRFASYSAVGILFVIGLFFYFAKISDKTFIRGYLDAESGIISVEAENAGLIKKVSVEEGQIVKKGQLLFTIVNPNRIAIQTKLKNLGQQLKNLQREYQIKKDRYHALKKLYEKNYISSSSLHDFESELLDLKNRLKEVEHENLQTKNNQMQYIHALHDGTVTNIMYREGQRVQPMRTLVQIIPTDLNLVARLYIPARAIGFLKLGQEIHLKYDAYPSQRFGFYEAIIKEINQTVLTDDKEDKPILVGESYYKIKAKLKKSYVSVYGQQIRLNHGMGFTAIVSGEKRKIWQWVLDPIYSFYGENLL